MIARLRRRRSRPSPEDLLTQVAELSAGADGDPQAQRRVLQLRHRAGLALVDRGAAAAAPPEPAFPDLPAGAVPEVEAGALSPELVRAAFLRSGCLLVRGLVGPADVARLREVVDRAYAAREALAAGNVAAEYEPFEPDPRYDLGFERAFVGGEGWGGLWAADAPEAALALFDAFGRAGLHALAAAHVGERPAISVNKCLLRKVPPPAADEGARASAWHQDGAFLGDVRALNVWLALTRCGDVAPGLDVVARRLDEVVPTGTEGAAFDWSVSHTIAEQAAGPAGIVRPTFEPGDALLFDELLLHATAADPGMPDVRYAIECWYFGPSRFPKEYAPLAV